MPADTVQPAAQQSSHAGPIRNSRRRRHSEPSQSPRLQHRRRTTKKGTDDDALGEKENVTARGIEYPSPPHPAMVLREMVQQMYPALQRRAFEDFTDIFGENIEWNADGRAN